MCSSFLSRHKSDSVLLSSSSRPLKRAQNTFFMAGFSLIEVLISLIIFTVGFLGLASLQQISFKLAQESIVQHRAMALAESMVTRIHVEGPGLVIAQWQHEVSERLPNGRGELLKLDEGYLVKVTWQQPAQSGLLNPLSEYQLSCYQ